MMKAYNAKGAQCTTPDFSFQNQQTFIIVSCGLVGPEGHRLSLECVEITQAACTSDPQVALTGNQWLTGPTVPRRALLH